MNRMAIFLLSIVACSVQNNSNNDENTKYFIIDDNLQGSLSQSWIKQTAVFTEKSPASGEPDLWGGGSLPMDMWFDHKGNMWYGVPLWSPCRLYEPVAYIDGYSTVVVMPPDTGTLKGTLYMLVISNNAIYRTEATKGFSHKHTWNGKTVPVHKLMEIGKK